MSQGMSEVERKLQQLSEQQHHSRTVSMRELNQKTRSVIDRVLVEGVSLTITDRGKPIAQIKPVEEKSDLDRLAELGVLVQRGRPFETVGELLPAGEFSLEQFLAEERDESWMDDGRERAPGADVSHQRKSRS